MSNDASSSHSGEQRKSDCSAYVLEGRDIEKVFGNTVALSAGQFAIKPGEVHAIVGENGAGKTTLMRILAGVYTPDRGQLFMHGKPVRFETPRAASEAGVGIVHQELAICKDISVAENMFLDKPLTTRLGGLRWGAMRRKTQEYLDLFSAKCDPFERASNVSLGEQQVIEIARAVMNDCKVVIFDEPTSSLSDSETEALYRLIAKLKERGIASVFITHRLSEVFLLSDRITIMRDGKWVETVETSTTTPSAVVSTMVGREISDYYPPKSTNIGDIAFRATDIHDGRAISDQSFHVRSGEILGIAGLVGSGRTELVKAAVGLVPGAEASRTLFGAPVRIGNYSDAVKLGICYMTEDRKLDGLFLDRSVEDNTVATILDKISSMGVIDGRKSRRATKNFVASLSVKADSLTTLVQNLSGGNQQKVMIAKWLAAEPKVLILDEPTRGIDVGAKFEIHRLIRELADQGLPIIVVSSELPEVIGLSDRVIVMSEGKISGELNGIDISEENIITLASQHAISA